MRLVRLLCVLAMVGVLASCTAAGSGEPTYTISGTITLEYQDAVGDVSVTSARGTEATSTVVAAPTAVGGIQTLSYSISGVPAGTYSVTVSFSTGDAIDYAYYLLNNDGVQLTPASFGNDGLTTEMTTGDIEISADLRLDLTTGRTM